jgi:hypothetical protein
LIEVSTPRDVNAQRALHIYGRRLERQMYKRLPVTSIPQTMLDLAASADSKVVRKALARLDFRPQLDLRALPSICGHGRPGSRLLLEALTIHQPRLAHTNGPLEYDFFA